MAATLPQIYRKLPVFSGGVPLRVRWMQFGWRVWLLEPSLPMLRGPKSFAPGRGGPGANQFNSAGSCDADQRPRTARCTGTTPEPFMPITPAARLDRSMTRPLT